MRVPATRFALGAIGCLSAAAQALSATPLQMITLATSETSGPIVIGSGSTRIELTGAAAVDTTVNALGQDRNVYLVIAGLHAVEQPGVVYDVHLSSRATNLMPGGGTSEFVGTLNFFAASDLGSGRGAGQRPTVSLNASAAARRLAEQGLLGAGAVVTIAPEGVSAASAKPTVGSVTLIAQ